MEANRVISSHFPLGFGQCFASCALPLMLAAPSSGLAMQTCEISSDAALYQERAEQAILLMQYEDIVVRATDGKIRCEEDAANAMQMCLIEGPGEMLIDATTGLFVVRVTGTQPHAVQIYASGDLSCGLASDME